MPTLNSPSVLQMPAGSSPRSLSIWFKLNSLPAPGLNNLNFLFYHGSQAVGQGFGLALGNNQIYLVGFNDDLVANVSVPVNQWAHLAATYNGSVAKLYLNGNLVAQAAKNWNTPNSIARLGHFNTTVISTGTGTTTVTNNYYNGDMDDFYIYSRELTAQEISVLAGKFITSVGEVSKEAVETNLYPNPIVGNQLRLERMCLVCEESTAQLFNATGAHVKNVNLAPTKVTELNVSDLEKGIYTLRIVETGESLKFIRK
jgi:hypothetical protein